MMFCGIFLLQYGILAAANHDSWPFSREGSGSRLYETDSHIGIYNQLTGVLFTKNDFTLVGLYHHEIPGNRIASGAQLWEIMMFYLEPDQGDSWVRYVLFSPAQCKKVEVSSELKDGVAILKARYSGAIHQRMGMDAEAFVTLGNNDAMPRWRLNAGVVNKVRTSIWQVEYPRINFKNPATKKADCLFALPYRNGILNTFPQNFDYPYPGPAVKFQMMSFYDRVSGSGAYLAAEDANGFNKDFVAKSNAAANTILLTVRHAPSGRREFGSGFRQSYDVVCGLRRGDWFDDAKSYRQWFLTTPYTAAGPVARRTDVPEWLKTAVMSMKLSCGSSGRTVSANVNGALTAAEFVGKRPILAIWYNFEKKDQIYEGMGRTMPSLNGVAEGLEKMRAANIHTLAYVQSMIYDHTNSKEMDQVGKYMALDILGDYVPYDDGIDVCRYTSWWHDRFLALSEHNLALGFEGIYLDSFGKGSPDCFAVNHGHRRSGGNTGIAGQRALAGKLRGALKSKSAGCVMSGEAPTEAFADQLDYYLLAVNVLPNSIPLWRTIAGEYIITHGRGMAFSKAKNNIAGESATLFLEGSILGRISVFSGKVFLEEPGNEKDCAFVRKLMDYVVPTLDYLRLGEMLRAPELTPPPSPVTFNEYIGNAAVSRPAVLGAVNRAVDGSLGYTLVNIGELEYSGKVKVDPALRTGGTGDAEVTFIGAGGDKLRSLKLNAAGMSEVEVRIAPRDILFFTVK